MICIGIDPGYEESAYVIWDGKVISAYAILPNEQMLLTIREWRDLSSQQAKGVTLVIEQIASMGMAVGKTTFETVYWSGRFAEAFFPYAVDRVPRRTIKLHLCGQSRATDANIKQAIIDRFGPSTEQAVGKKASKGPLYGITKHCWAALAVALTWGDQHQHAPTGEVLRPGITSQF